MGYVSRFVIDNIPFAVLFFDAVDSAVEKGFGVDCDFFLFFAGLNLPLLTVFDLPIDIIGHKF